MGAGSLVEQFDRQFKSWAQREPDLFQTSRREYFQRLAQSEAKVHGEVIKSYFHPYVLSSQEVENIRRQAETMAQLIAKAGKLWFTEEEVRKLYNFDPRLEEAMEVSPGYETLVPIARYDGFYNREDGSLVFCEFNADGSSGMNETNTMEEAFLATEVGQKFQAQFGLEYCELRRSLLHTLLSNFHEGDRGDKEPNIAIVDWEGIGTIHEFRALQEVFQEQGYATVICDPREVEFRAGQLWYRDFPIQLVYRRVVTTELLERWEEVQDFIGAYRAGAFIMVGSLRTELAHSKLAFCLFSDPAYSKYFTPQEREFLAAHIPWTRKLTSDPELFREAGAKKDQLVLKPFNSYGSRGVIVGSDCSQSRWEDYLRKYADRNYLVQEKITIPEKKFLTAPGKEEKLKINLSTFLYNEKLAGFYTRVSQDEVITTNRGAALVPTLVSK